MRLSRVLEGIYCELKNFKNYNIKSVTHISRDAMKGGLFVCIKGANFDGNKYVADVVACGVCCVVTEDKGVEILEGVCYVFVSDIRKAMSVIAKNFYNKCVDKMKVIGIVGTAGKTSTSFIINHLLSNTGFKTGVIGTNGIFIGKNRMENTFTTPDPFELHYILYQMKLLGVDVVIMEVSAQAIYYKKIYGISFDVCVFTNITKEHLDFFGSLENYARVKMDFFKSANMKECVVNIDDFYGREIAYKTDVPCVSYGVLNPSNSFAIKVKLSLDSTQFVANIMDDVIDCNVPLVGDYSVYNILSALTVARLMGVESAVLQRSINSIDVIEGRFNVYNINGRTFIIDFAHTPDSIEKLLQHIKSYSDSKIISVFGCVGYSDKEKRESMGSVVSKFSNEIVLTSDNSGNTPFEDICRDVIPAFGDVVFHTESDRGSAIDLAYRLSKVGDIVVLIGKGAETFQKIGDERVPYSEKDCVLKLMEKYK